MRPMHKGAQRSQPHRRSQVVLWPDTWNNYYHPQTLAAAESVLTAAGFAVQSPKGHICCGRPLYDFGLLGAARPYLARVLDRMAPQIDAGLPFIFLEPSCASVFKDELLELFPNDPRAKRLSEQVWLLADWLAANAPDFAAGTPRRRAHPGPRPLPSQGGLRRSRQRNRAAAPGRRHGRADPGRLLRHGRALRLRGGQIRSLQDHRQRRLAARHPIRRPRQRSSSPTASVAASRSASSATSRRCTSLKCWREVADPGALP